MALGFRRIYTSSGIPVFVNNFEVATGGFKLDKAGLTDGETVKAGCLMVIDEEARSAKVVKTARVYESGNDITDVKIDKGSLLVVGDSVSGVAISAISKVSDSYDVITVAAAVDVVVGDVLTSEDVTGKQTALLQVDTEVADNESVSVVIRGTVYAKRTYPLTQELIPAGIVLSNSY